MVEQVRDHVAVAAEHSTDVADLPGDGHGPGGARSLREPVVELHLELEPDGEGLERLPAAGEGAGEEAHDAGVAERVAEPVGLPPTALAELPELVGPRPVTMPGVGVADHVELAHGRRRYLPAAPTLPPMQQTTLGRTGLQVSVAGLGCGGHSRLGQSYGATEAESIAVVHRALDLGVNLVDTAQAYGTEAIVGAALRGRRDEVVVSTKALPVEKSRPLKPKRLRRSVERSLKELRTDRIDLFFVHGMQVDHLHHAREALVPELLDLKQAGHIRFLAASEAFASDNGHDSLGQSLDAGDDWYDVLMVGHNPFNPSARDRVLPVTDERDIGVLVMFAVRKALASADGIRRVVADLVARGVLDPVAVDADDPLGFLLGDDDGASSFTEAAYRFARHEPGCHVVLTGTGSPDHLTENVAAINGPPLPPEHQQRLAALFGHVDCVTGD